MRTGARVGLKLVQSHSVSATPIAGTSSYVSRSVALLAIALTGVGSRRASREPSTLRFKVGVRTNPHGKR